MRPCNTWLILLLLSGSACDHDASGSQPGKTSGDSGTREDADAGSRAERRPQLAVSGAQLLVTGPQLGLQLTAANLADDADVAAMHVEFYGIPWSAFETGAAPPMEWSARMTELATQVHALGRPVFLSISMLNGRRERLAATTIVDQGKLSTSDDTGSRCYDFASAGDAASRRRGYLRYVEDMVERFAPAFVNVAVEANLFFEKCPQAAPALIEVSNAAYDLIKARHPDTLVFPSFQIDHLYGYSADSCPDAKGRDACFDAHYAQLAGMKRDRFAISSYPFLNQIGSVEALPSDWFARGAERGGERVVIAETGWPSTGLVARAADDSCPTVFSFDADDSARYLARVLHDADELDMDLVTWWSDRDLLRSELMTDCPCAFDATWCSVLDIFRGPAQPSVPQSQFLSEVLLKAFGTMGLRQYDGTLRSGHAALWNAARKLR